MRLLRSILLALLFSALVGFAVGTWLRMQMERQPVYIGSASGAEPAAPAGRLAGASRHSREEARRKVAEFEPKARSDPASVGPLLSARSGRRPGERAGS